jgi:RNA polymerase sigma-70 factor (ECF subfamily)
MRALRAHRSRPPESLQRLIALPSSLSTEKGVMEEPAARAFKHHYRDVYDFVRRRSATDVEAEDVTAEVFEAAAAGLDRFRPGAAPVLAWLYTVARRRLVDQARRRSRLVALAPADPAPEYGTEVAAAIRGAIAQLSEDHRRVVVLRLLEGRSFRETAKLLEISEGACKMRLARALERLRSALEEEGVTP